MRRSLAMVAVLAISGAVAWSQQYQPGPYAPRQVYPPRGYPPYGNQALTNYYLQNQQRFLAPGALPPNYSPATRFGPNGAFATNFAPGNRFAPNPYSFTNVLPRVGYGTNAAQFAPTRTNLQGYSVSSNNFAVGNAFNATNFPPPSGTTNFLLPNSTNSSSRLAITPVQRQNINRLTGVLHAIKTSPVSSTQRQQILSTLRTSVQGATKPSDQAVTKFVDDFVSAWPENGFTYQQKFQLSLDLIRTLNSGNLTQGEALVVVNDARRVWQTAGVGEESMNALVDDLIALAGEVQKTSVKESAALPKAEK